MHPKIINSQQLTKVNGERPQNVSTALCSNDIWDSKWRRRAKSPLACEVQLYGCTTLDCSGCVERVSMATIDTKIHHWTSAETWKCLMLCLYMQDWFSGQLVPNNATFFVRHQMFLDGVSSLNLLPTELDICLPFKISSIRCSPTIWEIADTYKYKMEISFT